MNPRMLSFPAMFGLDIENGYPYYDVVKLTNDEFRIDIALAGFKKNEIRCELQNNILIVDDKLDEVQQPDIDYLRKEIGRAHV